MTGGKDGRLLDKLSVNSSLTGHALVDKLNEVARVGLYPRPGLFGEQPAGIRLFHHVNYVVNQLMKG